MARVTPTNRISEGSDGNIKVISSNAGQVDRSPIIDRDSQEV